MVDGLPPVDGSQGGTPPPAPRSAGKPQLFAVSSSASDQLPDMPPAEVLDALDTAARVLHELDRKNVSVRLEHTPGSNELRAHVSDASGQREISHGRLLNVLSGDTASLYAKS